VEFLLACTRSFSATGQIGTAQKQKLPLPSLLERLRDVWRVIYNFNHRFARIFSDLHFVIGVDIYFLKMLQYVGSYK
jgi:hypothetical protein